MPTPFDIHRQLGRRTQDDLGVRLRIWLGRLLVQGFPSVGDALRRAIATADYFRELESYDRVQETGTDRLSQARIDSLSSHDFSTEVLEGWHRTFTGNPESNIQWYVVPLVKKVLDEDASVRSVLNIGVKIAYFDAELAKAYPDRSFHGVDFMRRLAEFNQRYWQPNLGFTSGYALALLEKGEIGADLTFFSSTAVIIRNHELRKYLSLLRRRSRYVVLNEPLYTFPKSDEIVDPATVPLEQSFLIATPDVPPGYAPPTAENRSLCFVHNYPAMLEEAGFEVQHYEIVLKDAVLPLARLIGKAR